MTDMFDDEALELLKKKKADIAAYIDDAHQRQIELEKTGEVNERREEMVRMLARQAEKDRRAASGKEQMARSAKAERDERAKRLGPFYEWMEDVHAGMVRDELAASAPARAADAKRAKQEAEDAETAKTGGASWASIQQVDQGKRRASKEKFEQQIPPRVEYIPPKGEPQGRYPAIPEKLQQKTRFGESAGPGTEDLVCEERKRRWDWKLANDPRWNGGENL